MDHRMFATGENTSRLPVIDKRDGTMGERNGSGTAELIEMVFMFFYSFGSCNVPRRCEVM